MLLRHAETLSSPLMRPVAIVGTLFAAAVAWHLCLPGFFYDGPKVFIEGPLPAVAGVAIALWFGRNDPPVLQVLAACAWALLALLGSVLVFGTWFYGPFRSIPALWGELQTGFRLPFSALIELWGNPRFVYGFWTGLRPVLLIGTLAYVALSLRRRSGTGGIAQLIGGGIRDRWAFNAAQRRQLRAYQATYLAALRGGEAPPPPPSGLMVSGSGTSGLTTAHLLLRIGLAIATALGFIGGGWALLGDALRSPLSTIFWRGLSGG